MLMLGATLAILLIATPALVVPALAQGPPHGPPAAPGAFATSQEIGTPGLPIEVPSESFVEIAQLNLPPGNYVVVASLYLYNGVPGNGIAYCLVQIGGAGGPNAQTIDTLPGLEAVSQALTVAGELSVGGTATLKCKNNTSTGDLSVQTFNLNAIRVSTLAIQ